MRKKNTLESRLMEREEEKQLMAEEEAKAQKFEELRQALKQQQKVRMQQFGEEKRIKKIRGRTTERLKKLYGPFEAE